jgi:hypothetical protein
MLDSIPASWLFHGSVNLENEEKLKVFYEAKSGYHEFSVHKFAGL